jgi:pectate lyase
VKRKHNILMLAVIAAACSQSFPVLAAPQAGRVLAFPGAEGYGAATTGGRGGSVVRVTSLNDMGKGSLRWALETLSGPRTVIFDVGGTIRLGSQILVRNGDLTIAGQTAPGQGITIEGAGVRIKASNVIVRGVRFRPGDGVAGEEPEKRDGLMIGAMDFPIRNIIVDHNSFTWAIDENFDIQGKVRNVTISNNIIAEGLSRSLHPKGEHSKGMLVSNWKGAADDDARITIVKNLFSDNAQRNPEVRAGQDIEIVNNYIYNYGIAHIGMAIGGASEGTMTLTVDVIGNVLRPGPSTPGRKPPIFLNQMTPDSKVALVDNLYLGGEDRTAARDQSKMFNRYRGGSQARVSYQRMGGSDLAILPSSRVAAYVLQNAGARSLCGRDSTDRRIIAETAAGSGRIIDHVADVRGAAAPRNAVSSASKDSDGDGMSDWFEEMRGFRKDVADGGEDADRNGYTNLEEYLNAIIAGFDQAGRNGARPPGCS